jgi:hypothetical protein
MYFLGYKQMALVREACNRSIPKRFPARASPPTNLIGLPTMNPPCPGLQAPALSR